MGRLDALFASLRIPDEDVQRRGRILNILALGLIILSLVYVPISLITGYALLRIGQLLTMAIVAGIAFWLGRSGRVTVGAYLLIGVMIYAVASSIPGRFFSANILFFTILPVLFAGVLLTPIHIWNVLIITVAIITFRVSQLPPGIRYSMSWNTTFYNAPLLLFAVALVSFLNARATVQTLRQLAAARAEAETANQALTASNATLETRVEERTVALRQALEEQRAIATQLQASLATQQELNRVIASLSIPVIPISAGTLVAPIIGNLDTERARLLLTTLLAQVEATRARTVVLDITGVAVVDDQVAAALLQAASAARLMGAETVIVGIRPEVAHTLVHLGADLSHLHTAATLQDALQALDGRARR
ncbi:MAG: STAS domain-containing protein [Oscillochloridaceae bacterium]|nr:STAS domain-containing protein [Chloroflexaceae bacterium]MDW8388890.1 STAS domain-containing protein [Oscillochloridaceae bacterium]